MLIYKKTIHSELPVEKISNKFIANLIMFTLISFRKIINNRNYSDFTLIYNL